MKFESLEHVCKIVFAQQRKTIQNCAMFVFCLKILTIRGLGSNSQNILQMAGINSKLRPHQLSVTEINKLALCWQQLQ